MKKHILLLFALASCASILKAQGMQKRDHIPAMKIGFITQKLQLSPDEAKQFWPVYDAFQKEKKALHKQKKLEGFKADLYKEDMSEAEAKRALENMTELREKELALYKKYIDEFLRVLPAQKVLTLWEAEKSFHAMKRHKRHPKQAQEKH